MTANEIRNLKWVPYTKWEEMVGIRHYNCICRDAIDCFVENVFRQVARDLQVNYSEAKAVLNDENHAFFDVLDLIYDEYEWLSRRDERLLGAEKLLRIPVSSKNSVDQLIAEFHDLTKLEKIEFLSRIEKVSIEVKMLED